MTSHRRYHNRRANLRHWMGLRHFERLVGIVARRVRAEMAAGR